MKIVTIAAAITVSLTAPAAAEYLEASAIKGLLSGRKVLLATDYGIEFPLNYGRNGVVVGDGTHTGLGRYFAPKEAGKWWVSGNKMCQRFPTWYDGKAYCFRLRNSGAGKLHWVRDDGYVGTARIVR